MENNIKKEFINSIVATLKIENNVFNYGLIDDLINHIKVSEYRLFYNQLFGEEKRYLSGLDRVKAISLIYADRLKENQRIKIDSLIDHFMGYYSSYKLGKENRKLRDIEWEDGYIFTSKEFEVIQVLGGIDSFGKMIENKYGDLINKLELLYYPISNVKVEKPTIKYIS